MYAFEFDRPTSLQDALAALADDDVQALAGGQTLIPTLKARLASPSKLVSLGAITELNGVCLRDDGEIAIGATTTHATVAHDVAKYYPALAALAGQIGDPAVRNRGTIGGSIANNDPSACYPAAVLASGATIVTNAREITAGDYFQGMFTTDLTEGELIVEVRFPVPQKAA
jgi:carbon-monoxide dehydrogenase medium subunit